MQPPMSRCASRARRTDERQMRIVVQRRGRDLRLRGHGSEPSGTARPRNERALLTGFSGGFVRRASN